MLRMFAEHLVAVIEGAAVFGMVLFVLSTARDVWLSVRRDE